MTSALFIIAK